MIFSAYKYTCILCVGADSYVDANAGNQIQGFRVCCLYFKLELLSSKRKAKRQAFLFA